MEESNKNYNNISEYLKIQLDNLKDINKHCFDFKL